MFFLYIGSDSKRGWQVSKILVAIQTAKMNTPHKDFKKNEIPRSSNT